MELSEMEIGLKLELELYKNTGDRLETMYVSEYEGPAGEDEAYIAAPIFEGRIVAIHPGTFMNIYFIRKVGNDIQLYTFRAAVVGREMADNLYFLRIKPGSELEKVQRRNYYRLNCSLQVNYRIVDFINEVYNEHIPFKTTFSNNISGGGISLKLEEKIDVGQLVECDISASAEMKIRFLGKVTRCGKCETEGKYKYEAGIAYLRIRDIDREAVVRFIFREQRKLRKKGLI